MPTNGVSRGLGEGWQSLERGRLHLSLSRRVHKPSLGGYFLSAEERNLKQCQTFVKRYLLLSSQAPLIAQAFKPLCCRQDCPPFKLFRHSSLIFLREPRFQKCSAEHDDKEYLLLLFLVLHICCPLTCPPFLSPDKHGTCALKELEAKAEDPVNYYFKKALELRENLDLGVGPLLHDI